MKERSIESQNNVSRKRGVDNLYDGEQKSNDKAQDPEDPSSLRKRICNRQDSSQIRHFRCPFIYHLGCGLIARRDLSGIKEHLRRNHFFGETLGPCRSAKNWDELFQFLNPDWEEPVPSPFFDLSDHLRIFELLQPGKALRSIRSISDSTEELPTSDLPSIRITDPENEFNAPLFDIRPLLEPEHWLNDEHYIAVKNLTSKYTYPASESWGTETENKYVSGSLTPGSENGPESVNLIHDESPRSADPTSRANPVPSLHLPIELTFLPLSMPTRAPVHRLVDDLNLRVEISNKRWTIKEFSIGFACPFAKIAPKRDIHCLAINAGTMAEIKRHIALYHIFPGEFGNEPFEECETWGELFDTCSQNSQLINQPSPYFLFGPLINYLLAYINADEYIDHEIEHIKEEQMTHYRDATTPVESPDVDFTEFMPEESANEHMKEAFHQVPNYQDNDQEIVEDNHIQDFDDGVYSGTTKIQALYMLGILLILRNAMSRISRTELLQNSQFHLERYMIKVADNEHSSNGEPISSSSQNAKASTSSRNSDQDKGNVQKQYKDLGRGFSFLSRSEKKRPPRTPRAPKNIEGMRYLHQKYCCPCGVIRCINHPHCWKPRKKYYSNIPSLRQHLKREHYNNYELPEELKTKNAPEWPDMYEACAKLCGGFIHLGKAPFSFVYIDHGDPEHVYERDEAAALVAAGTATFVQPGESPKPASTSSMVEDPHQNLAIQAHSPSVNIFSPPAEALQPITLASHGTIDANSTSDFVVTPVATLSSISSSQAPVTSNLISAMLFEQPMNSFGQPQVDASHPITGFFSMNVNSESSYNETATWATSLSPMGPPNRPNASLTPASTTYTSPPYSSYSSSGARRGATSWGPSPISSISSISPQRSSERDRKFRIAVERGDDSGYGEEEGGYVIIDFDTIEDIRNTLLECLQARFYSPLFTWESWRLVFRSKLANLETFKSYENSDQVADRMDNDAPSLPWPDDHIHRLSFAIFQVNHTANATTAQESSTIGSRDIVKVLETPSIIKDEAPQNASETWRFCQNEMPVFFLEDEKSESTQEKEMDQISLVSIDISRPNNMDFSQDLQSPESIYKIFFGTEYSRSQTPQPVPLDIFEEKEAPSNSQPVSLTSSPSCGNKAISSDSMDTESYISAVSTSSIGCALGSQDISTESSLLAFHTSKSLLLQKLINMTNMHLQTKIKIWPLKQFSERLICPFAKVYPEKHVNCLAINYRTVFEVKSHILRCHLGSKQSGNGQLKECNTWEEIFKFCFPDSYTNNQPSPYFSFDPLINHLTAYTNAEDYISCQMEALRTQQTKKIRYMEELLQSQEFGCTESSSENYDSQNEDETLEQGSPTQSQISDDHDINRSITQDIDAEFNSDEYRLEDYISELVDNFPAIEPADSYHQMPKISGENTEDKLIALERTSKIQAIYMLSILMILRNAAYKVSGASALQHPQFTLDRYLRQIPNGQSDNGRSSTSTSHRSGASTIPIRSSSQHNGGVQKQGGDDEKRRRRPRKPLMPKGIAGKLRLQHEYCCPCALTRCARHPKCWTPRKKYSFSLASLRHHIKRDHFNNILPDELKKDNAPSWDAIFLKCAELCENPWQGQLPSFSVYVDRRDLETVYEDTEAHYCVSIGLAEFSTPGNSSEFASVSSELVAPMQGVFYGPQNPEPQNRDFSAHGFFPTGELSQPQVPLHNGGGGVDQMSNPRAPVETRTSTFSEQSSITTDFNLPMGFQQNMNMFGPPQVNATNAIPNTSFADVNVNEAGMHDQAANWTISSVASRSSPQIGAPPSFWNNSYTDFITPSPSSSSSGVGRAQIPRGFGRNGYFSPATSVSISSKHRGAKQSKKYRIAVEPIDDNRDWLVVDFDSTEDISTNLLQHLQKEFSSLPFTSLVTSPFTWEDWNLRIRNEGKSYKSSRAIAARMYHDPPPRLDPPEDHIHKLAFDIVKV